MCVDERMKKLTPVQRGVMMRCPADWSYWGTDSCGLWSNICTRATLHALREKGWIEVEFRQGVFWRRKPEAGPQPETHTVDLRPTLCEQTRQKFYNLVLAAEVKAWLNENAKTGWWCETPRYDDRSFAVHFADEIEAVHFKLRWM